MIKRLTAMSAVAVTTMIGGAPAAHAACLAADAYVVQNGSPTYIVPFHTCLVNTAFPAAHLGTAVTEPILPPALQGVGFDVWVPIP